MLKTPADDVLLTRCLQGLVFYAQIQTYRNYYPVRCYASLKVPVTGLQIHSHKLITECRPTEEYQEIFLTKAAQLRTKLSTSRVKPWTCDLAKSLEYLETISSILHSSLKFYLDCNSFVRLQQSSSLSPFGASTDFLPSYFQPLQKPNLKL